MGPATRGVVATVLFVLVWITVWSIALDLIGVSLPFPVKAVIGAVGGYIGIMIGENVEMRVRIRQADRDLSGQCDTEQKDL